MPAMRESRDAKPVFLLTHSRACSTAIERIFWANKDIKCFHEDFGAAFYYGPERVSDNWKRWEEGKLEASGQSHVTWKTVLDMYLDPDLPQKFVFIKDMGYHIIPPKGCNVSELPSLKDWDKNTAEVSPNPTWLPASALRAFQFGFLIRSPWLAVPSLYRLHWTLTVGDEETKLQSWRPNEVGYREIRILVEYLYPETSMNGEPNGDVHETSGLSGANLPNGPILIDASDVLSHPEEAMSEFSARVGLPFTKSMLSWDSHDSDMEKTMSKFKGCHDDAISSTGLRRQTRDEEERQKSRKSSSNPQNGRQQNSMGMEMSEQEYISEWTARYGSKGAEIILEAVNLCRDDYTWLRRLAIKPKTETDPPN